MKLEQPISERNKEFFILAQTLFNQEEYVAGSNILSYYQQNQLDDLNKCEKFRTRSARMNTEGQSCFLDLIDTKRNCLAGCIGYVKVNRIFKEAQLALIYYQKYFEDIKEAVKCFSGSYLISKYNLRSVVCDISNSHLNEDAIDILMTIGFRKAQSDKNDTSSSKFRYLPEGEIEERIGKIRSTSCNSNLM